MRLVLKINMFGKGLTPSPNVGGKSSHLWTPEVLVSVGLNYLEQEPTYYNVAILIFNS